MGKIYAIALTTYRESIRSNLLYSTIFFAFFLVCIAALFGTVTIGDQMKVIKDFGLFSISVFSLAFVLISGSSLLAKELSKKTVYNILSKSVTRFEFILGKFIGMLATVSSMVALMGAALLLFVLSMGDEFGAPIFEAYFFILLELTIVCAATIFFSSIVVTPMLSGLFALGVFLAGRSTEHLSFFINDPGSPASLQWGCKALYALLPHLDRLYISDVAVYGQGVPMGYLLYSILYCIGYSGILLTLSNLLFSQRDFN